MIVEDFKGDAERAVLIDLITDDAVLAAVVPLRRPRGELPTGDDLFASPHGNLILGWCAHYYSQYRKAPGLDIAESFRRWAEDRAGRGDRGTVELINALLVSLSDEAVRRQETPAELKIQRALDHLERVRLRRIGEYLTREGQNGHLEKAKELLAGYAPYAPPGQHDTADAIDVKEVRWLWPGWLARGELAIVDGLPGEGKSLIALDLAARVSGGRQMPPGDGTDPGRKPAAVVLVTNEDSWEHTLVPRLMAARADLTRIVRPGGAAKDFISFPADLPLVETAIRDHRAKLLVVDTIMGTVGGRLDHNSETEVRQFTRALRALVQRTRVSALLIRHFKKEASSALHRGLGSQAWTAVARLGHVAGKVDGQGVMACAKNNLAEKPQSLGYRVAPAAVCVPADREGYRDTIDTARVEWAGTVALTANDVAGADRRQRGRPPGKQAEAADLIRKLLAHGPMDSRELERRVSEQLDVGATTFRDAKKTAGVQTRKRPGFGAEGGWLCELAQ
jgi:hypothetical protein